MHSVKIHAIDFFYKYKQNTRKVYMSGAQNLLKQNQNHDAQNEMK